MDDWQHKLANTATPGMDVDTLYGIPVITENVELGSDSFSRDAMTFIRPFSGLNVTVGPGEIPIIEYWDGEEWRPLMRACEHSDMLMEDWQLKAHESH